MTYDFKALKAPSLNILKRVTAWGAEPERQARWLKHNKLCKVIIPSGYRFLACRAIMNLFFQIIPPVTRTLLVTDPDEPEANAVVFDPPQLTASCELLAVEDGCRDPGEQALVLRRSAEKVSDMVTLANRSITTLGLSN